MTFKIAALPFPAFSGDGITSLFLCTRTKPSWFFSSRNCLARIFKKMFLHSLFRSSVAASRHSDSPVKRPKCFCWPKRHCHFPTTTVKARIECITGVLQVCHRICWSVKDSHMVTFTVGGNGELKSNGSIDSKFSAQSRIVSYGSLKKQNGGHAQQKGFDPPCS